MMGLVEQKKRNRQSTKRSKSQSKVQDKIVPNKKKQFKASDLFASDNDTVLGGESLYCTNDDEIAKGSELKLKAKPYVRKVITNEKEQYAYRQQQDNKID